MSGTKLFMYAKLCIQSKIPVKNNLNKVNKNKLNIPQGANPVWGKWGLTIDWCS